MAHRRTAAAASVGRAALRSTCRARHTGRSIRRPHYASHQGARADAPALASGDNPTAIHVGRDRGRSSDAIGSRLEPINWWALQGHGAGVVLLLGGPRPAWAVRACFSRPFCEHPSLAFFAVVIGPANRAPGGGTG